MYCRSEHENLNPKETSPKDYLSEIEDLMQNRRDRELAMLEEVKEKEQILLKEYQKAIQPLVDLWDQLRYSSKVFVLRDNPQTALEFEYSSEGKIWFLVKGTRGVEVQVNFIPSRKNTEVIIQTTGRKEDVSVPDAVDMVQRWIAEHCEMEEGSGG